jgi:Tol biopolymer transport system component
VKTQELRALARTSMSTATGHLTWAPGTEIAYQAPGHHAIILVDPSSGAERSLTVDSDSTGFMMSPQYSPDGKSLVFGGGPINDRGVWRIDLRDSTRAKIGDRAIWPRGWSSDGRYLYGQSSFSPVLHRLNTKIPGPAEQVLTAPFREADCTPVGSAARQAFVCAAFDFTSDIYAIDLKASTPRWLAWMR